LKYISSMIDKIKDSKKIKATQRNEVAEFIKNYAIDYQVMFSDERTIEEINIRNANFKNMHNALNNLKIKPQHIIVDGNSFPEYCYPSDTSSQISHTCIVKGDNKYISIAAASILAKTSRDDYILDLVKQYPDLEKYGLKNNFGYSTPKHIKAIKTHGPSQYHRKTFGVCKIS
jgi:ribonuclease HII